ncbi:peptidase dimerization domain-containing protein [Streptomyces anulatus]|uniref:peptidase dimerization domain-containing protein n=1 Tax=Streptomyces anulatus TaxID=1892 RepID=UPI001C26529F|nr:peptidase dimerization domain-containing protein [Streptomyces anulatus]
MDLGDDPSTRADALMDGLVADPERLTAIPSVAFPGSPPEPVREAHDLLLEGQEEVRSLAGLQEGMPLIGSGGLGERLWSGPAITVIGIDAPSVDHAASAVVPYARAEPNLRFHPEQDPREARDLLVTHPESLRPFGIPLTYTPGDTGPGFEPATDGPAYRAARTALREGWGSEPAFVASGDSLPLVNGLAKAVPGAEVLLFGAQDGMGNLHAPNEPVHFSELRSAVIAETAFPREYAQTYGDTATHARSTGGVA